MGAFESIIGAAVVAAPHIAKAGGIAAGFASGGPLLIAELAFFGIGEILKQGQKDRAESAEMWAAIAKKRELERQAAIQTKALKEKRDANFLRSSIHRWGRKQELGRIKNSFASQGVDMYSGTAYEVIKKFEEVTRMEVLLMQQGQL
jgi:hypothetical protein